LDILASVNVQKEGESVDGDWQLNMSTNGKYDMIQNKFQTNIALDMKAT